PLEDVVDRWVVASLSGPRTQDGELTAERIASVSDRPVEYAGAPAAAIELALRVTPGDGRILCCGSFHIVGPALEALGLYS
ncbi:MAG: bifunctional tetrahydrofolate synthase/dihydrofolate synthase, partial [Gammaproteobacteria bacterium]|nr:bifunctional tetrahydrofolate synthase/dihydrofolate synthase [Gammaproteobacteria bacterium]